MTLLLGNVKCLPLDVLSMIYFIYLLIHFCYTCKGSLNVLCQRITSTDQVVRAPTLDLKVKGSRSRWYHK